MEGSISAGVSHGAVAIITVPTALTPRSPVIEREPSVLTLTDVKQNGEGWPKASTI